IRTQPTPLIGRASELESIRRRLADEGTRLLTLVGPAGVGKTRLALAAAAATADHFPDGVTLVDLSLVHEPAAVITSISRTLGLVDGGPSPLPQRLETYLRERQLLLVLDNFEQVLPAATLIAELLTTCPGVALLVTSRVPLQLRWEQALRVLPLAVPDLRGAPRLAPPELAAIPAVALFMDRARARQVDFALTAEPAPLVRH